MRHLVLSMVSLLFFCEEVARLRGERPVVEHVAGEVRRRPVCRQAGAQVDPADTPAARRARLARAARKTIYWQRKRERSARSHRKRRLRELRQAGIRLSWLRKCAGGDIAL
jgi:hypothetical protein